MRHLDRLVQRPLHGNRRRSLLIGAACAASIDFACAQAPVAAPLAPVRVQQPQAPVPLESVQPGPPTPPSRAAAPLPDKLPDLTAISGWAIPPIRWGGSTTSNYNWNDSAGVRSFNETQTANLRASSYIYQPWYAQVSGDVGLLTGTARQSAAGSATTTSRNTSLTYGGNLNLFPQSRFPFQAYLQTSDSRAAANAMAAQYNSLRMGARQSYRPEIGSQSYSASADRSIVTSSNVRSVVDALQGNFSTSLEDHSLAANARYARNGGDVAGQGSQFLNFGGSHSWRADEDLTIASSANVSKNQVRMLNANKLSLNDSQILQAGSTVTWVPDEDLPLTITGGGNILHMNTKTEFAAANLASLNGYANAAYRITDNLTATGGMTLARNQADGRSQFASAQNAAISYSGIHLTFGDYSYNWGTGANITNQMISEGTANRNISGNVQHALMRHITLGDASAIALNASQSYSITTNSLSGQSGVLTHSGGGSWRLGIGDRTTSMLNAMISDSMSSGAFSSHYRSFSTQGNLQTQISARSAVTANLNFIVSQQLAAASPPPTDPTATVPVTPLVSNGSTTMNGSGQLAYSHRSPFGIANLFYTAAFQANASQTNLRLVAGDPNAQGWQTGKVFQQNADYRMGRLMFRLTNSLAALNGKKNASLFLMIGREIGDF